MRSYNMTGFNPLPTIVTDIYVLGHSVIPLRMYQYVIGCQRVNRPKACAIIAIDHLQITPGWASCGQIYNLLYKC